MNDINVSLRVPDEDVKSILGEHLRTALFAANKRSVKVVSFWQNSDDGDWHVEVETSRLGESPTGTSYRSLGTDAD